MSLDKLDNKNTIRVTFRSANEAQMDELEACMKAVADAIPAYSVAKLTQQTLSVSFDVDERIKSMGDLRGELTKENYLKTRDYFAASLIEEEKRYSDVEIISMTIPAIDI